MTPELKEALEGLTQEAEEIQRTGISNGVRTMGVLNAASKAYRDARENAAPVKVPLMAHQIRQALVALRHGLESEKPADAVLMTKAVLDVVLAEGQ